MLLSALRRFSAGDTAYNLLNNPDYHIPAATVVSNEREIYQDGKVTYMPVYLVMFMEAETPQADDSEYLF